MAKAGREPMELTMTQEPSVDTDDRADEAWLSASSISGAKQIPTAVIVSCGTGSRTHATYDAPGGRSPRTEALAPLESTGRRWHVFVRRRDAKLSCKSFVAICDRDGIDRARVAGSGYPSRANLGSSDP